MSKYYIKYLNITYIKPSYEQIVVSTSEYDPIFGDLPGIKVIS